MSPAASRRITSYRLSFSRLAWFRTGPPPKRLSKKNPLHADDFVEIPYGSRPAQSRYSTALHSILPPISHASTLVTSGIGIGALERMTMHLIGRIVKRLAFVPFLLTLASPVWAQNQELPSGGGFAKDGLFVGVSTLLDFSFSGDTFDGESAYMREGGEEIVILPRFDGAHNIMRFVGGYRVGRGSFEVSYDRTKHNGTFIGAPVEATFYVLNFDERIYLMTKGRIQPHVLFGGSDRKSTRLN